MTTTTTLALQPATWPRDQPLEGRLLLVEPRRRRFEDRGLQDLPSLLQAGDLLVMNDAATLPASLAARTAQGEPVEVRLAGFGEGDAEWRAVLFGAGDWRTRTEDRPSPPPLAVGAPLRFAGGLGATLLALSPSSPRLVDLRFDRAGDALWEALYRAGAPIQYSYLRGPLPLWHVQTAYGARPWAMELPSAGRPLTWELLAELRRRGVRLAALTHAAGLSSTGDPAVDALLPFPERFDVPQATVDAVEAARRAGGRVVAVGTTVVRALEGAAALHGGRLRPGSGVTALRIAQGLRRHVVDGLFTGLHEPGTSHFDLLTAFAPESLLRAGYEHAVSRGYLGHEFGDSSLILDV